ncbi:Uncharacterised protein [Vibrio cholerae]|nr:Uncharacterised protein [Vibrio cholerae]
MFSTRAESHFATALLSKLKLSVEPSRNTMPCVNVSLLGSSFEKA